jgi:phenylalanyl-tRNA synthetase alpha chain
MELHPNEAKILKILKKKAEIDEVAEKTSLDLNAVNRTLSWLSTKDLVKIEEKVIKEISLGEEGKLYADKGLPERRIIRIIGKKGEFRKLRGKLSKEEVTIGLGWLRKKDLGTFSKGRIEIRETGKTGDEKLLEILKKTKKIEVADLNPELERGLQLLRKRKNVVNITEKKTIWAVPTGKGLEAGKNIKIKKTVSQLTPQIIKTKKWQKGSFRPYDIDIFVKPEHPAKKHPLQRLVDRIREIFVAMGFREVKGPLVESSFWNFDALFVPQDHPARDMHDTFYLENPRNIEIPGFDRFKEKVKETHENGWTTGSTGWGNAWDEKLSKMPLMRTHTTAVTCRYLTQLKKKDLPVKVFCIGKTFRNEAIDYKHLPEFYQVEGIVVDENANFRNLLGILDEFYTKMGFKVRFRPGYFPYTEMSVEPEIYMKDKGWMELGGSGIFRPEVVKPLLGFDCPVLAWGLGLDRVVALSLGLEDIRDLYISDLDWLRRNKVL